MKLREIKWKRVKEIYDIARDKWEWEILMKIREIPENMREK